MLTTAPLAVIHRSLGIDRILGDEHISGRDKSNVLWRSLDGLYFPLMNISYVDDLTEKMFADFEWKADDSFSYGCQQSLEDIKQGFFLFHCPIAEVLINAFLWGNKADIEKNVQVQIFEGDNGRLLQVKDQGDGFDYRSLVNKVYRGEKYWQHAGNGMSKLQENPVVHAGYDHASTSVFLAVFFPEGVPVRSDGELIQAA